MLAKLHRLVGLLEKSFKKKKKKKLYQLEEGCWGDTMSHRWARRGPGAGNGVELPAATLARGQEQLFPGVFPRVFPALLLVSAFLQLPACSDAMPWPCCAGFLA